MKALPAYRDLSLRAKLWWLVLGVSGLALGLAGAFVLAYGSAWTRGRGTARIGRDGGLVEPFHCRAVGAQ